MYNWFNTTLTLTRDQWVTDNEGNKTHSEKSEVGTIKGNLQQADAKQAELLNLTFGKTYNFYTRPDEDIKEGDTLKDGDDVYKVEGVRKYEHPRMKNAHLKVILQK